MSGALAVDLIRQAVMLALVVAAPLLLTALTVGILVSLFQAVTQIQEQTLTFIPKVIALALVLMALMPWVMTRLIDYLVGIIRSLPTLVT